MIPINEKYLHKVLHLMPMLQGGDIKEVSIDGRTGYSFPCPYCAIYQKKESKKRKHCAFFLPHAQSFSWTFFCHRKGSGECMGGGKSLSKFLEEFNPQLFKQYQMEMYKAGRSGQGHIVSDPDFSSFNSKPFQ